MVGSLAAAPSVHIWVRTAIDWDDEEALLSQVEPGFRPHIERWNETFALPYHRFRHEVSEIARLNLSRVAGAAVTPWEEIPDDAVVLPVDDDDWFAPDLVDRLQPYLAPRAIGYRWVASDLEVPTGIRHWLVLTRRRLFPGTPLRWICGTNNYALVKQPGTDRLAVDHCRASEVFAAEHDRVPVISERLNLVNRTLASKTTMYYRRPSISRVRLLVKYRAYRRLYRRHDLAGIEWAEEYVERMNDLMGRLELRSGNPR